VMMLAHSLTSQPDAFRVLTHPRTPTTDAAQPTIEEFVKAVEVFTSTHDDDEVGQTSLRLPGVLFLSVLSIWTLALLIRSSPSFPFFFFQLAHRR
jgi:hypothetical protein